MGGEPRLHPGLELLNDGAVEIQAVLDLHEAAVLAEQLEYRGRGLGVDADLLEDIFEVRRRECAVHMRLEQRVAKPGLIGLEGDGVRRPCG